MLFFRVDCRHSSSWIRHAPPGWRVWMFHHGWEPAEGTVVERRVVGTLPAGGGFGIVVHEYLVEVRLPDAEPFRAKIQQKNDETPHVGDAVQVVVNPKNHKHVAFA